ncbi:sulfurtransferase [Paenibacillus polymyxa]|uniref:rhodanese-like domain-containing protein n=1 Tax=Paenibacillus polymyxa TaxID=1406 RepID=UPI0010BF60C6|nr:rhodanese-like domain-containing protein [Paenibacillus polymyxa]TKH33375.1 sulfurtransferase [Paenibacillus polymyxa]
MAKTFADMVQEARQHVQGITSQEARQRIESNPDTFVIEIQDSHDAGACGLIRGSANISLGMLPIRADLGVPQDLRDERLRDRNRPIITTCGAGGQAALAAYILQQMGFTDVAFIEGGTTAWKESGFEVELY